MMGNDIPATVKAAQVVRETFGDAGVILDTAGGPYINGSRYSR